VSSNVLPKFAFFVFRVSLVWLSNAGLTIDELTNTHRLAFTWWGLIVSFFGFFF